MKTEQGVSVAVSSTEAAISFVAYTLVYAALIVANVYLLAKYAKADTAEPAQPPSRHWPISTASGALP